MSIIKTFWNFVDARQDTSLKMFAKPTAIVDQRLVTSGCRGVFFRSVLTEELDFSNVLSELKFEDIRKARNEPDTTLLFKPKCNDEKSIGVLRVMKPRRFVGTSGINTNVSEVNLQSASGRDFDVLLETTEFVLEDVQEQMAERFQLQETFGDFNVFFFGKRAEIFTYSGSLINAKDNLQWRNQFLDNYERFLRGTRCAELKARAYLLYDDVVREGFILSANVSQNSMTEAVVKFSFTLLVTSKRIMGVIPPSRSGTLTLSRKTQNQQGVTDFQFFRALADDLPSVADLGSPQGPGSIREVDPSFSFVQNNSLPGDEPPADLKQQMMTRALSALQQVNSGEIKAGNDETLDQDILLDFISAANLGTNTKLIISGAKSLDIDNFTGDQLVELLLDGKITINDLKLKQAAQVADSFSRTNKDRIDPGTADTLEEMAKYFATNSMQRVSTSVTAPEKGVIVGDKEYVLESALDLATLNSLLTTVVPLNNFDQKAANDLVLQNVKLSFVEAALRGKPASADILSIEAYLAAFCLIKDPNTGNLFSDVTLQLPDAAGASSDAMKFIRDQKVSKVKAVIQALPVSVRTMVSGVIAQLQGSALLGTINTKTGITKPEIFVNEAIVQQAIVPDASKAFLMSIGVYIAALASELSSDVPPACIDAIGGTMRKGANLENMGATYYTSSFLGALTPGSDSETSNIVIGPKSFGPNLRAIIGTTDWYLILPFVGITGSIRIGGDGFDYLIAQTDPTEQTLQKVGIIRVNEEVFGKLILGRASVLIPTTRRSTPVLFKGCLSQLNLDRSFTPNGPNANEIEAGPPLPQNHLGTTPINRYIQMTSSTLAATVENIHQKLTKFQSLVDQASQGLEDVLANSADPAFLESVKAELAIDRFTSITEIANINTALTALGITVSNVIDLVEYAKVESVMAMNLATLKQRILDAIAQAQNDPENQAAAVAKNNESFTNAICG